MELLTTRLARLEDRLLGTTPLDTLRKVDSLWRRLLTAASNVGEAAAALGDGPTLQQLGTSLIIHTDIMRSNCLLTTVVHLYRKGIADLP